MGSKKNNRVVDFLTYCVKHTGMIGYRTSRAKGALGWGGYRTPDKGTDPGLVSVMSHIVGAIGAWVETNSESPPRTPVETHGTHNIAHMCEVTFLLVLVNLYKDALFEELQYKVEAGEQLVVRRDANVIDDDLSLEKGTM